MEDLVKRILLRCSCGATAVLYVAEGGRRMWTEPPDWPQDREWGWTCGKPGHQNAGMTPMHPVPPAEKDGGRRVHRWGAGGKRR